MRFYNLIVCSLASVKLNNSSADLLNQTFTKFKYFAKMMIFLTKDKDIYAFLAKEIVIFAAQLLVFAEKPSTFSFNLNLGNQFLLMSLSWQVVERIFLVVKIL